MKFKSFRLKENIEGVKITTYNNGLFCHIEDDGVLAENYPVKGIFDIVNYTPETGNIVTTCGRQFKRKWIEPFLPLRAGCKVRFKESEIYIKKKSSIIFCSDRGVHYQHHRSYAECMTITKYTGNGWYKIAEEKRSVFHDWLESIEEALIVQSKKHEPATKEDLLEAQRRIGKNIRIAQEYGIGHARIAQLREAENRLNVQNVTGKAESSLKQILQRMESQNPKVESTLNKRIAVCKEEYDIQLSKKKQVGMIYNIFELPLPASKKVETVPYVNKDPRADWWSENIRRAEVLRREAQQWRVQL